MGSISIQVRDLSAVWYMQYKSEAINNNNNNMSGGHWDYKQYQFTEVIEDLRKLIEKSGKPKTKEEMKEELWHDESWYERYPEDNFHYKYPDEVIEEFKNAVDIISRAQVYMHRIDWLLSGDDGDESFIERLNKELKKL